MGIDITQVVTTRDGSNITDAEARRFFDDFMNMVEGRNWMSGGACGLTDVDTVEGNMARQLLVILGTAHELSTLGLHEEAETIMGQALMRFIRGGGTLGTELTNDAMDETLRGLRG